MFVPHSSAPIQRKRSSRQTDARYHCTVTRCSSKFTRHSDLIRHEHSIHGPKIQCTFPHCRYSTGRMDKMNEHKRKKHVTHEQSSSTNHVLAKDLDVSYSNTMDGSSLGSSYGTYHLTENAATELLCVEGLGTLDLYGIQLETRTLDANASLNIQDFECRNFPAVPFFNDFPHYQVDWSLLADTSRSCGLDEWNSSLSSPYIYNA